MNSKGTNRYKLDGLSKGTVELISGVVRASQRPCSIGISINADATYAMDIGWLRDDARRERIATAAMQGLLASMAHPQACGSNLKSYPELPQQAVEIADALIDELDKDLVEETESGEEG